jgi:diadenosine tetraphosphate (Ap4A) HIT family hydrolase
MKCIECGEDAGQTVFHCHVHLIPRRKGDVDEPKGGVRGVIPEENIIKQAQLLIDVMDNKYREIIF